MVNHISNYFLLSGGKPPSSSSWSSARTSLSHTSANGFTGSTLNGYSIRIPISSKPIVRYVSANTAGTVAQ